MSINYIYDIAQTSGTTGYASCRPESEPEFDDGLALLEERPLDTFLHRHLLHRLLLKSVSQWQALAQECLGKKRKTLAALLLETAVLVPDAELGEWEAALNELVCPWHEHTPLTLLAAPREMAKRNVFWENIHQHQPLPAFEPALIARFAGMAARMDSCKGALARVWASFRERCTELSQAAGAESPAGEVYARASSVLAQIGISGTGEMRHEASLSPIALLRQWKLRGGVAVGRNAHTLAGDVLAYGRGLKLIHARVSCSMEIVERASAHAFVEADGKYGRIGSRSLVRAEYREFEKANVPAVSPSSLGAIPESDGLPLHWLPGEDSEGMTVMVPAQAVYLFCNLDEVSVCEHVGSTGLASGDSPAMAKLGALCEILERDAHASTPFRQSDCFELQSRDPVIQALLDDYRWRGIRVQFQDISNEFGLPAYRAFVRGHDGSIAQATGAGLCGARAVIAALTETPWPYVWAKPVPAPSGPGLQDLPFKMLEDLPDYSLPTLDASLAMLEHALISCGHKPVYVDISRADLSLPVYRAFIPGLAIDPELDGGPSSRLLARCAGRI